MINVDRKPGVTLVTDPVAPPSKRATALEPGDVIAVPFAGYGDLLAEVTSATERGDLMDVTVSEPEGFSYTTVIAARSSVRTYPATAAGTWRR